MATTAWVVGATEGFLAATFTVNAAPTGNESKTVAAGDYYLVDYAATAISLAHAFATAVLAHTDITSVTTEILESRLLKFSYSHSTTITWGSATTLRNLLGFAGNLSAATSHTATLVSPLLWSPAKTESPDMDVLSGGGMQRYDAHAGIAASGIAVVTSHNQWQQELYRWRNVANADFRTTSALGGEFFVFWRDVLRKGYHFRLYRNIAESRSGSAVVNLGAAEREGPYVVDLRSDPKYVTAFPFDRSRGFEHSDIWHPVELPCVTTAEIS